MRRAARGFTLIEVVLAMTLLGGMMVVLYSGLTFALRSWDVGEASGRATADRRIGEHFLRRELLELFPMRWKDANSVKVAFSGQKERLRFVSSRPAGITMGGLALVGVEVEGDARKGERHLVMRRAMPDEAAVDFAPLDEAEPNILLARVEAVRFDYFGSESDFAEPKWYDEWKIPSRIPNIVRMRVTMADGTRLPDMVMRIMLGEEAGCLESAFQRACRPRRP